MDLYDNNDHDSTIIPFASKSFDSFDNDNDIPIYKELNSEFEIVDIINLLIEFQKLNINFINYTSDDIKTLASLFTVIRYNKDDVIIQQGENGTFFGMLLNGTLNLKLNVNTNNDEKLIPINKGSVIGEMCLFTGGVRNASLIAETDGILAVLSIKEFQECQEFDPIISLKLIQSFAAESVKSLIKMNAPVDPNQKPIETETLYRKKLTRSASIIEADQLKRRQEEARSRAVLLKTAEDSMKQLQRHIRTLESKISDFEYERKVNEKLRADESNSWKGQLELTISNLNQEKEALSKTLLSEQATILQQKHEKDTRELKSKYEKANVALMKKYKDLEGNQEVLSQRLKLINEERETLILEKTQLSSELEESLSSNPGIRRESTIVPKNETLQLIARLQNLEVEKDELAIAVSQIEKQKQDAISQFESLKLESASQLINLQSESEIKINSLKQENETLQFEIENVNSAYAEINSELNFKVRDLNASLIKNEKLESQLKRVFTILSDYKHLKSFFVLYCLISNFYSLYLKRVIKVYRNTSLAAEKLSTEITTKLNIQLDEVNSITASNKNLTEKLANLTEQLPRKISENNEEWVMKYDDLKSKLKKYEKLYQELEEAKQKIGNLENENKKWIENSSKLLDENGKLKFNISELKAQNEALLKKNTESGKKEESKTSKKMIDELETKLDETYDLKSKLYAENANNSILQTSLHEREQSLFSVCMSYINLHSRMSEYSHVFGPLFAGEIPALNTTINSNLLPHNTLLQIQAFVQGASKKDLHISPPVTAASPQPTIPRTPVSRYKNLNLDSIPNTPGIGLSATKIVGTDIKDKFAAKESPSTIKSPLSVRNKKVPNLPELDNLQNRLYTPASILPPIPITPTSTNPLVTITSPSSPPPSVVINVSLATAGLLEASHELSSRSVKSASGTFRIMNNKPENNYDLSIESSIKIDSLPELKLNSRDLNLDLQTQLSLGIENSSRSTAINPFTSKQNETLRNPESTISSSRSNKMDILPSLARNTSISNKQ